MDVRQVVFPDRQEFVARGLVDAEKVELLRSVRRLLEKSSKADAGEVRKSQAAPYLQTPQSSLRFESAASLQFVLALWFAAALFGLWLLLRGGLNG